MLQLTPSIRRKLNTALRARKNGILNLIQAEILSTKCEQTDELNIKMMIKWDTEFAPLQSQLDQLKMLGYVPLNPIFVKEHNVDVSLNELLGNLACVGVFIAESDHLSDVQLYTYLVDDVLDQKVRLIPFGSGVHEVLYLHKMTQKEYKKSLKVSNRSKTVPSPMTGSVAGFEVIVGDDGEPQLKRINPPSSDSL